MVAAVDLVPRGVLQVHGMNNGKKIETKPAEALAASETSGLPPSVVSS